MTACAVCSRVLPVRHEQAYRMRIGHESVPACWDCWRRWDPKVAAKERRREEKLALRTHTHGGAHMKTNTNEQVKTRVVTDPAEVAAIQAEAQKVNAKVKQAAKPKVAPKGAPKAKKPIGAQWRVRFTLTAPEADKAAIEKALSTLGQVRVTRIRPVVQA